MRGILCALRTKEIFNAYRGSTSQDLSTYQIPEHVARMGFLAIRRFEGYQGNFLSEDRYTGKGIDVPSSCILRCWGTHAGEVVTITIVTDEMSFTHEFESIFGVSTSCAAAILEVMEDKVS